MQNYDFLLVNKNKFFKFLLFNQKEGIKISNFDLLYNNLSLLIKKLSIFRIDLFLK